MARDPWADTAQSFYDQRARAKAETRTFTAFVHAYRKLLKRLPALPQGSVLDVGCGSGYLTSIFSPLVRGPFVGIDISSDSLKTASEKNPRHIFIQADMTMLPLQKEHFDFVFAVTSLEFCHQRDIALKEIHDTLKNGGKFYLEVRNRCFYGLLPDWIKRFLVKIKVIVPYEAEGFRDLNYEEWKNLLCASGMTILEEMPSLRPWNYGSLSTQLKNLIIKTLELLTPLNLHYMVGFYCTKLS